MDCHDPKYVTIVLGWWAAYLNSVSPDQRARLPTVDEFPARDDDKFRAWIERAEVGLPSPLPLSGNDHYSNGGR